MPLTPEEFQFYWNRPPLCKCGTKMRLMGEKSNAPYYVCHTCVLIVSLKGAGADFASKAAGADHQGKHADQLKFCRDK